MVSQKKQREYNLRHREYKRIWQYKRRHGGKLPPDIVEGPKPRKPTGNAKYQALLLEEKEWLKKAKSCDICNQRHPPHKHA